MIKKTQKVVLIAFFCLLSNLLTAQNLNQVAKEIKKKHIRFKTSALSMAYHETGGGKSKVFKNKLNAFGITNAKGGYTKFNSVGNSVLKFKIIHDRIVKAFKPKTEKQFLQAVCKYGYATDRRYYKKVYKYFEFSEKMLKNGKI